MPKKTELAKAIEQIEAEIAVLIAAKERLRQQQMKAPARRPRAVPVAVKGAS